MTPRIREIRQLRKMRLVDVGARFDPPKDPSRISRWENGKETPRGDNLVQLARILGCKVEDFFVPN